MTAFSRPQPLVSVLTPSLNQAAYIGDCIASVENQDYQPIEHIIYDGGSCDGTLEILAESPDHVQWASAHDDGQANALNKAFRASSGEVIGWLNSDDAYADTRTVQWAVDAFLREPALAVVFGHALIVNESRVVLQVVWSPPLIRSLLGLTHYIFQPTLFFRRSAIGADSLVREDLQFVFDRDLVLRLVEGVRFARIPRVLAIDRHQHKRKVETPEFEAEVAQHAGYPPRTMTRQTIVRTAKAAIRLCGIPRMAMGSRGVRPAIPLEWPPLTRRLKLQLLTPRRRMPFSVEKM
jgi:glycosyltransferase involved in cell wall biosynthesis